MRFRRISRLFEKSIKNVNSVYLTEGYIAFGDDTGPYAGHGQLGDLLGRYSKRIRLRRAASKGPP